MQKELDHLRTRPRGQAPSRAEVLRELNCAGLNAAAGKVIPPGWHNAQALYVLTLALWARGAPRVGRSTARYGHSGAP